MENRHGRFFIGTSGWPYDHWEGPFYPDGLPDAERLEHYAAGFGSVEINQPFYSLPQEDTLRRWRAKVPASFRFAVKASRYLTHMKKLKDPQEGLDRFLSRMRVLGDNMGPVPFPPGPARVSMSTAISTTTSMATPPSKRPPYATCWMPEMPGRAMPPRVTLEQPLP